MTKVPRLFLAVRGPLLIGTAVVLGLWIPLPRNLSVLTTPLVALLIFAAVYGSDRTALRNVDRPTFPLVAIAFVFFISLVFAPIPALILDGPALVGVLVAIAAPSTAGSAIVWTKYGGGDASATVIITLSAIGLAPLVTPILLAAMVGHGIQVDPLPVVLELGLVVTGGGLLWWLVPDNAISEETVGQLSLLIVGLLVYVGTATSPVDQIGITEVGIVGVLAFAFLVLVAVVSFAAVYFIGWSRAVALFFSSGLRNLGIGVAVAGTLHVRGVVVAVVVFYIVQQLCATVVAEGARKRYRLYVG